MTQNRMVLLVAWLVLSSCASEPAPTSLWLHLNADLRVPDEVNQLELVATGQISGDQLRRLLPLRAPFPHSFKLQAGGVQDEPVTLEVTLRKQLEADGPPGEAVARRSAQASFVPGALVRADVDFTRQASPDPRCEHRDAGGPAADEPCNGVDDDCDGQVDEGCVLVCSGTCATAVPLNQTSRPVRHALTRHRERGSCGGDGPEATFSFVLDTVADVKLDTHGSPMDTLLYVRACACDGPELGCNDDAGGKTTSALQLQRLTPGRYTVFVDSHARARGPARLHLQVTPWSAAGAPDAGSAETAGDGHHDEAEED